MFNFKNILETFIKNTAYLIFMTALTWVLVFLKPEWMYVWFYYSDPKNWIEDSISYALSTMFLILSMTFVFLLSLFLLQQKKYKTSMLCISTIAVGLFIMNYVANTALYKEIHSINYKQYLMDVKTSNLEAKKVAFMLKGDCQITVLELNKDLFGLYQWNPKEDEKLNTKSCEITNESKKELIDYLQGKGIL